MNAEATHGRHLGAGNLARLAGEIIGALSLFVTPYAILVIAHAMGA